MVDGRHPNAVLLGPGAMVPGDPEVRTDDPHCRDPAQAYDDLRLDQAHLTAQKVHAGILLGGQRVAVFVGPEGGFEEKEIDLARETGAAVISLGKRILRAETAAVTAVGLGMLHVEMNLDGDEQ